VDPYVDGRWFRPVHGVGVATIVFVWLSLVSVPFLVPQVIHVLNLSRSILAADDAGTLTDAQGSALLSAVGSFALTAAISGVVVLTAFVLYWVWSWRARCNAEGLAGRQSQDLSRGWTFWGWLCPIVSLWFPCQILVDIHRASDTRERRHAGLVVAWWICFLGAEVLPGILVNAIARRSGQPVGGGGLTGSAVAPGADALTASALPASVLGLVLSAAAAALLTVVILRINRWQSTPRTVPAM
jgi:hypothetical protein